MNVELLDPARAVAEERPPPQSERISLPAWHSLRLRLPVIMSALITVVLATFLWVAYRQVESALLQAGGARAQGAADQLANLLAQSTQQRLGDLERAARSSAVREFLQQPSDSASAAARQRLLSLATPGQPAVELWDPAGQRLLTVAGPPAANGAAPPELPAARLRSDAAVNAFQASHGVVFWDAVAEVPADPAGQPDASPSARRLGYVFSRRLSSSASGSEVISRLVGAGAVVAIGNQSGDVWTNLSKVIPAPPIDLHRTSVAEYRATDGQRRLGASSLIRGTPWAIWIEFPLNLIVAPARTFLARMLIFGLCFVVASAVLARTLSARITTPLHELTDAAEAIAAGKQAERVEIARRDEIGRLGAAFNTMATRVHVVQRELEERVQQRTARLAEAAAQLEQRIGEINETREELDRFFSLSLDLMGIAGADGRFRRVNRAWERTLGWTPAELTSTPFLEFVHPDERAATASETAKLAAGGMTVSFENRYRAKDGTYRWLSWSAVAAPERGLIYAAARDVTEQKRAAVELEQRAAELAAANQELEAFSYSVSHDLRAPLRHVTGFASLLQQSTRERLKDPETRHLQTIVDAAARMGRLIDDLLAFSRMGRSALRWQRVSLDALVRDALQELQGTAPDRAIIWNIHPLPDVVGDPAMLRLVLVNLLSNAVKYTAGRAPAEIEVGANGHVAGETVVHVRDNGAGFDMEYAHKLFGVFQRLHSSDDFEGTGIGLANVRRIVQRHGGRVWAEGVVDGGATFFFSLPTGGATRDR